MGNLKQHWSLREGLHSFREESQPCLIEVRKMVPLDFEVQAAEVLRALGTESMAEMS